jgi:hypothetical protein
VGIISSLTLMSTQVPALSYRGEMTKSTTRCSRRTVVQKTARMPIWISLADVTVVEIRPKVANGVSPSRVPANASRLGGPKLARGWAR